MDAGTAAHLALDAKFQSAVDAVIAEGDDWDEELYEAQGEYERYAFDFTDEHGNERKWGA